jgi:hypothetical protein
VEQSKIMPSVHPRIIRKIKIVEALARDNGGDPIPELVLRRYRLCEECELRYADGSAAAEAAFDALCNTTADACAELDEKIAGMVATSKAGIMAQTELLAGDENDSLCVDGEVADRLAASIATGIHALADRRDLAGRDQISVPATIDNPADGKILVLFHEWMAAIRAAKDVDDNAHQDEWNAAYDRADALEVAIFSTPADGPVGLALKTYLLVRDEDTRLREDPAALSGEDLGETARALVKDAVHFVPQLAPLAANFLEPHTSEKDARIRAAAAELGRHYLALAEKKKLEDVVGFGDPEPQQP